MANRCLLALALCLVGLTFGEATAAAQDSDEKVARAMVREGNVLYRQGKYADALKRYKFATQLRPKASTLFNRAQCHRQLKQYEEAIPLYQQYLELAPAASDRAIVLEWIAQMKAAQAEATPPVVAPAPASTVTILPRPSAMVPAASPIVTSVADEPPRRTWYQRWYVWVGVGVVVAGAVVGAVVATRGGVDIPVTNGGTNGFFQGR